jgi:hypothetical protein
MCCSQMETLNVNALISKFEGSYGGFSRRPASVFDPRSYCTDHVSGNDCELRQNVAQDALRWKYQGF